MYIRLHAVFSVRFAGAGVEMFRNARAPRVKVNILRVLFAVRFSQASAVRVGRRLQARGDLSLMVRAVSFMSREVGFFRDAFLCQRSFVVHRGIRFSRLMLSVLLQRVFFSALVEGWSWDRIRRVNVSDHVHLVSRGVLIRLVVALVLRWFNGPLPFDVRRVRVGRRAKHRRALNEVLPRVIASGRVVCVVRRVACLVEVPNVGAMDRFRFILPHFFVRIRDDPRVPRVACYFLCFLLKFRNGEFVVSCQDVAGLPGGAVGPFDKIRA